MNRPLPEHVEMDNYGIVRCAQCGSALGQKRPLSPKQSAVFTFIESYIAEKRIAPSFTEIAAHMGFKNLASVFAHLIELERKGWIKREYRSVRGITIIADERT